MELKELKTKLSKYRFEIRHITIFFAVLIIFQIVLTFIQKSSLERSLNETQTWYQKHSAERLAIITSTSMELLFENMIEEKKLSELEERKIISSFNVIFKQQLLQKSVDEVYLILMKNNRMYVIDSGRKLYQYLSGGLDSYSKGDSSVGINLFLERKDQFRASEIIYSELVNHKTFNILVPFVPDGEYLGAMYMKITPSFDFITNEIASNYDYISIIYSLLIFFGLLAIFWVSSQAVKERNEARQKFLEEHEENIKNQVRVEKELLFTKR
ncbi:MAG: histidine kinase, partial [Ignavibacteriae bacterium]|nr:histidine kinase [Ignavibacteriota bacterium]